MSSAPNYSIPKSIAILPFVDMSIGRENEFFGDGISEEIINALTKIEGLKVTARTSSFAFKNKNIDIRQIGNQLGVKTILEGSIRIANNRVRITAQLINVEDGFHFWSETFDRQLEDFLDVQEEISLLIADKLRENYGHFDLQDSLFTKPEINPEVYKRFLEGRYHIRKFNVADIQKGTAILSEVIEQAPDFPLPYLSIYLGYSFLGAIGLIPAEKAFREGKFYLNKAIELDPKLPECQYHLASASFWEKWDIDSSYQHLSKAIELQPSYADAYNSLARVMATEGKLDAASKYIEIAIQLDPFSAESHYWKGCIFYLQEKYNTAIQSFEKSLFIDAQFLFSEIFLAACYLRTGHLKKALAKYLSLPPAGEADLSKLGGSTLAYAMMGDKQQTENGIHQLQEKLDSDVHGRALFFLIMVHTTLGNHDKALAYIRDGITHRFPMMLMLNVEPFLKPLRHIDRFQALMSQIFGKTLHNTPLKKKYGKSSLKEEQIVLFNNRLEKIMASQKPYLDPGLNLRQLAQMIDIHPNQLSQLLNEQMGQNFSSFVNGFRLEHFKIKAKDPSLRHLTLLGLALECGFSSKTVFNTYFKKKMGITPSQYWKQIAP